VILTSSRGGKSIVSPLITENEGKNKRGFSFQIEKKEKEEGEIKYHKREEKGPSPTILQNIGREGGRKPFLSVKGKVPSIKGVKRNFFFPFEGLKGGGGGRV